MILIVILGVLVIGGLILTVAFSKDLWLLVRTHTPWWVWLLVIVLGVAVIQELRPSQKAKDSLGLYEYRISDKWMTEGEYRIYYREGKITRVISSERLPSRQIMNPYSDQRDTITFE